MTSSSAKPPPFPTSAGTVQQTVNTISGRQYDSDNGKNGDDGFLVENYVVGNDVGFNGCGNISTSL